ncbi:hypothetical protein [Bifidobacterium asteroides]|nr:hypothetical protein [Bifidobacterium asteroides]
MKLTFCSITYPGLNDYEFCDYIGIDITVVISRAKQRVIEVLGPYPPR